MVNQLPQGWKEEELGKHYEILRGGSPRPIQNYITDSADGINWIKIGDVDVESKYIEKTKEKIKKEGLKKTRTVNVGDIILSNSMSYGRPYILKISGAIHDGWIVLRSVDNSIKNDLLYYSLLTSSVKNQFEAAAAGGVVKNLNIAKVSKTLITYPTDKGEQDYIVKTLDAVAEMIKLRKETIQLTKDLIPAIFQEMFGDPITNPKGWKVDRLGNQAKIVGGGTPKTSEPSFWNGDVPWITPKDLSVSNSLTIRNGERFITAEGLKNSSAEMLPAETVLFTSRAPIGYLAIAQNPLCTNQGFKSFICGSNLVPLYLLFYLDQIMDVVKGMASGATFKEISASTAKQIPILCPPLSLQKEFADNVEQINQNIEVQQKDLDRLQELFDQLLQKAFTGELTRGEAYGKH